MAKSRPSKWVLPAFIGAGLPLLAAYVTNTESLTDDLRSRAGQVLSSNEQTAWAKLDQSGRDFVLQGTAPSQEALDAAVKSVAGTYGVRTVTQTVQIVEPVKMTAPTVESLTSATDLPEIKGSWNEGVATNLSVGVGGTSYKLGESPELTSLAGDWLLKLTKPLAEGEYDITVESSDGKETLAAAPGKLVIDLPDAPKLALPTVENFIGNTATPTFKGTWPEVEAKAAEKNLQVKLNENLFVLGTNPELTTDGAGNWQLVPSMPLLEGELSVMPGLVGADGKWITAEAPGKAIIDLTAPALPELVAPAPDLKWPFAFAGKWPELAGNTLSALFAGKTFEANKGEELKTDGQGNFTFDPKLELAPGSYDLNMLVKDAAGNVAEQKLAAAVVIPEAPKVEPLKNAVVDPLPDPALWPFAVTGSWDEKPGNTLSASVAGRTYVLGRGAALTSSGPGLFNFLPAAKLAPGSYDIDIITANAAGAKIVRSLKAAITVAEPKAVVTPEPAPVAVLPTAATMDPLPAGVVWPYDITGTWDAKPGNNLSASVNGRTYVLGRGAALTSPEPGKFVFKPSATFAPGSYDVDFTTTNSAGVATVATAKGAIVVPAARSIAVTETVLEKKIEIPVPTVTSQLDLTGAPIIKGTFANDKATKLAVTVDGRTYNLGADANLAARDGTWTLLPGAALKDGTYDVVVKSADEAGNAAKDTTSNELVVDGEPPAAPTVMTMSGDVSPDHLSGTFDEAQAKNLKVSVPDANVTAEIGAAASPLTSDGAGNWRLNLAAPLPPGNFNVIAETTDQHGRVQTDATEAEVVIVAKGEPVPQPVVYDCVAVMDRIGRVFPIRFEFDLTDITKPFDLSVSQYAALLKDPRCTSLNVEIKGHADFRGTEIYNMGLSERRADVILNMLMEAGVDTSRLSIKALGESQPLDPAQSDEARMKNRRVEITVKP